MRLALLLSLALHALLLAAFAWQFRPLPALTPPLQVLLLPASLPAAAVMTAPRGGDRAVAPAAPRQPAAAPAPAAAARRAAPPPSTPSTPSTPSMLPAATLPATAPATGKATVTSAAAPAGSSSGSGSNAAANLATASTAPAAAEGKAGGGAEKAGESRAVRVRFSPKPPYPALSRELGEEGVVLLRISVGAGGEFEQVQLLRSSGFVRLDRAARDGVRSWRFDAAWQGGQPVAASIDIPVRFRLDES
ncbi:energy transducer TonB [Vogesella alkaliphila]|uniref:TonB C-terminal domain-containing protein n=1 Tax=Vogesella alkaliphila TaxID=1193621 RepID=A0ABQ2YZP2_9NEIS|nr:energy transducer TonB [Vogesella alkaliphila]GGX97452.1 hypothetical protein GCM10011290_26740 [Vogesella alkaliphila]